MITKRDPKTWSDQKYEICEATYYQNFAYKSGLHYVFAIMYTIQIVNLFHQTYFGSCILKIFLGKVSWKYLLNIKNAWHTLKGEEEKRKLQRLYYKDLIFKTQLEKYPLFNWYLLSTCPMPFTYTKLNYLKTQQFFPQKSQTQPNFFEHQNQKNLQKYPPFPHHSFTHMEKLH